MAVVCSSCGRWELASAADGGWECGECGEIFEQKYNKELPADATCTKCGSNKFAPGFAPRSGMCLNCGYPYGMQFVKENKEWGPLTFGDTSTKYVYERDKRIGSYTAYWVGDEWVTLEDYTRIKKERGIREDTDLSGWELRLKRIQEEDA